MKRGGEGEGEGEGGGKRGRGRGRGGGRGREVRGERQRGQWDGRTCENAAMERHLDCLMYVKKGEGRGRGRGRGGKGRGGRLREVGEERKGVSRMACENAATQDS